MHRLIYISRSLIGHRADEIEDIVSKAAIRNAAASVTGMLWSDQAHFVQALEGDESAVMATFERIKRDGRHMAVEIVVDRPILRPMFGKWSMVQPDDGAQCTESTVFLIGLTSTEQSLAGQRVHDVLLASIA